MKIAEIAKSTNSVLEPASAGQIEIHGAAGLDIAGPGEITFLANPKYTPQVAKTKASAIFVGTNVVLERSDLAVLRTSDPYVAYTQTLRLFHPPQPIVPSVHQTASIAATAVVDDSCEIGAFVSIGEGCTIAENVRIFPNVTIYKGATVGKGSILHSGVAIRENSVIGENCIIHDNAVIGCDGFGYARTEQKQWLKIPQVGRVVLEDNVEIGANSTIDKASVGETRIKRGTKIDNLVQIGHSCTVDEDALICAQTGLAGSSFIGKRSILAGQVGIAGHLKVGDDVVLTAKSATSHDIENGKVMSGIPAFDNREWLRATAAYRKLGEMAQRLRELQRRISKLESGDGHGGGDR